MRTLDSNLLVEQKKKSYAVAIKITLTHGADTIVLEEDRLKKLNHIEEPWRINAKETEFQNSDGYFTDKDLKGYKAVISHGLVTKAGKKYSDTSPMWVTWQQLDSSPGNLICQLTMLGIPDLMDEDEASDNYIPDKDDTKTVKTLLTEIATATLSVFSHCQAFQIMFDSEDSLIDSYCPKDSFRIYTGGSRLAAFKRVLEYCGCVARFEADGKIHVFEPTTTGSVYDYEYSLSSGHTFFSKVYRKSLVIPNYIVVKSQPDDEPQYSGYASDAESYALLPKHKYYKLRLQSNAEATLIAEAILGRYQLNAEMGAANVPMNCGAELYDYVKVTDEREDDYRVGNIGYIRRSYNAEKRVYSMPFGLGDPPIVRHTKELYQSLQREISGLNLERLYVKDLYAENIMADNIDMVWLDPEGNIDLSQIGDTLDSLPDGEVYARIKSLHLDAGQIKLDEHVLYSSGYNPTDKFDLGENDLDDIPEGTVYQRVKSASLTAAGLVLLDQVVVGTYGLVKSTDISAGHILLSKAEADGEWYNESGITIDADTGIVFDSAISSTLIRWKRGTDWASIYLGANQTLWIDSPGVIRVDTLLPMSTGTKDLGSATLRFKEVHAEIFHPKSGTDGGIILGTLAKAEQGSIRISTSPRRIYVHIAGVWNYIDLTHG